MSRVSTVRLTEDEIGLVKERMGTDSLSDALHKVISSLRSDDSNSGRRHYERVPVNIFA